MQEETTNTEQTTQHHELQKYHWFLDEAGDTTFYGKGKIPIIGSEGVSSVFILGMLQFHESLNNIRIEINKKQTQISESLYYKNIPSVLKRTQKGSFYFHAKDDLPEIRKEFFDFILKFEFTFEAIVARKDVNIYERKHNGKGNEFYADLLSHLLKDRIEENSKNVLNIAQRKNSTEYHNLQLALQKAIFRFNKSAEKKHFENKINFNVQPFTAEPLFAFADYCCWAVQRVFEKGETRFYEYIKNKISYVLDLYDKEKNEGKRNRYTIENPLSIKNKISPHLP